MPAVKIVRFNPHPAFGLTVRPHAVYLKENWGDSWGNPIRYLYCDEATWTAAPQVSTAALSWRFGQAIQPGRVDSKWYDRRTDSMRGFVKVVYPGYAVQQGVQPPGAGLLAPIGEFEIPWLDGGEAGLTWVGSLEQEASALHGGKTVREFGVGDVRKRMGEQHLICYGLEHTLAMCPINGSIWTDRAGRRQKSDVPFVFNAPDAAGKLLGNYNPAAIDKAFLDRPVTDAPQDRREWSTRTIVKYLVANFGPKSLNGPPLMSVTLVNDWLLPENDKPVFDPTGMSLWDCLCNLINRSGLLGFYVRFNPGIVDALVFDSIQIVVYTLVDDGQASGEINIPANPRQVRIDFDFDADIKDAGIKYSALKEVDQIIFRGARRTSTCSLSHADNTLIPGWNITTAEPDEEDYEAGGSTQVGYAALGVDEKQRLNAEVRSSEALYSVYRYFVHPGRDWIQRVGDGEGGAQDPPLFPDGFGPPPFPGGDPIELQFPVNPRTLFVLPCTLLLEGLDYSYLGTAAAPVAPNKIDNRPRNRTAPLVFFKVPKRYQVNYAGANIEIKDRYWIEASKIGEAAQLEETADNQNHRWSCRVEVPNQSYGVLVHVEGQPQHVIAKTDFTKLPVDEVVGDFDWREMIITCSFEDDRYCEGKWPPNDQSTLAAMVKSFAVGLANPLQPVLQLFATKSHVRRHVVYVGDEYRQDWICAGTVIGVNAKTGALVRQVEGAWIQDDRFTLQKRARQMFQYFGKRRRSLTFSTSRINDLLQLGDYVTGIGNINSLPIGSVITQMRVASPEGNDPPRLTYETSYLELQGIQP